MPRGYVVPVGDDEFGRSVETLHADSYRRKPKGLDRLDLADHKRLFWRRQELRRAQKPATRQPIQGLGAQAAEPDRPIVRHLDPRALEILDEYTAVAPRIFDWIAESRKTTGFDPVVEQWRAEIVTGLGE